MRCLVALCLLVPATASAQAVAEPTMLAGAFVTNRDSQFPASPALSVGLNVRIDVPAEGYQIPISPFFGAEGTLLLIEDHHELLTTMRGGFRLDSPGYPRVFGFIGRAWPVPVAEEVGAPAVKQTVVGSGLSLRIRRVTLEGRYVYDRRWETGNRTAIAVLVGSTF